NWTTPKATGRGRPARLYNLAKDIREKNHVLKDHPEVIQELRKLAKQAASSIGNDAADGSEARPALTLDTTAPLVLKKK
ncbi:MAG: hypothetical protein MK133_05730, partial [Planctomycetes bacterium]|nr:hypothetical protein [Planctomycetota bacterium]